MRLTTVESSMLHAVGYDADARELEVIYNSGAIWRYRGVPRRVYRELLTAPSKGQFMHAEVLEVYEEYPVSRRRR